MMKMVIMKTITAVKMEAVMMLTPEVRQTRRHIYREREIWILK